MTLSELLEELKGIDPETYEALRYANIYDDTNVDTDGNIIEKVA